LPHPEVSPLLQLARCSPALMGETVLDGPFGQQPMGWWRLILFTLETNSKLGSENRPKRPKKEMNHLN